MLGSRHRQASNAQSQLCWLGQRAGKEHIPRAGGPSLLPPLSSHHREPREDRGVRHSPAVVSSIQTAVPPQPGGAGRAERPKDGAREEEEEEARKALQVAPPRSLKFEEGEGADSILPLPPPRGSARPGRLSLALFLGGSSALFPLASHRARVLGSPLQSPSLPVPARSPLPPYELDLPHDVSGK